MGNGKSKGRNERIERTFLSSEEEIGLQELFSSVCHQHGSSRGCEKSTLIKYWQDHMEKELVKVFEDYFFKEDPHKNINFDNFIIPFAKLVKSPNDEKADFMMSLLKHSKQETSLSYDSVVQYVVCVMSSYIKILIATDNAVVKQWSAQGFIVTTEGQQRYAELLCQDLEGKEKIEEELERWFSISSQFHHLQSFYFSKLYNIPQKHVLYGTQMLEQCLFPMCENMKPDYEGSYLSILSLADVLFLNSLLPEEQQRQWRFCFSTKVHGESFSKMLGMIVNQGPTLIIIRDKHKHVFGGYATENWILSPTFHGTEQSFLFTLYPKMKIYESTGYNEHYQYLNTQQQTLPNGLGMGGQFEYFGFWLDAEFGQGHCSETCTTFRNYKMMSGKKYFNVDHVEVWGVGPLPKKDDSDEENEIKAEKQNVAKALLEIAGKQLHGEAFREEPK